MAGCERRRGRAASVGPGCWGLGVVTSCEFRSWFISGLRVVVGDAPLVGPGVHFVWLL